MQIEAYGGCFACGEKLTCIALLLRHLKDLYSRELVAFFTKYERQDVCT